MIVFCPLLVFSILPSLEAVRSSGEDQKALHVREPVDFSKLVITDRERKAFEPIKFDIRHIDDEKNGDLCSLDWRFFDFTQFPTGGHEVLRLKIHLDAEEKAFTYVDAHAEFMFYHRDLNIEENTNKLTVKALEYGRGESGRKYPKIEVGAKDRGRAENVLSEGGRAPFSPFAHLKRAALDRLIKDIDWKKDGGEDTCERIYFFLAFNAPDGYVNGNLAWLFDFVNKNAPRIEKQVRELQKKK
ncbi:hypothetical protein FOZ63_021558 [Perkinsus olseni]|uniref:Uncharacterized protein n=1 Tax=Perkinsus olseni TaxID=32597 RepID=A0A7J6SPK6_PEROL|nr:hypothetical protein FOZ63_021558 [Perkinsus olseni]